MGASRQTGKQTSRDGDKQARRQAGILIRLLRKLSPSRVSLPFPSMSLSHVCTALRLFVGACFVSGWALSLSLGLWSV